MEWWVGGGVGVPPAAGRIVMAAAQERLSLLLASYCTKGDWPKLHYGAKILLFLLGPQAPAELGWAEIPSTQAASGPLLILPPGVPTQPAAQAPCWQVISTSLLKPCYTCGSLGTAGLSGPNGCRGPEDAGCWRRTVGGWSQGPGSY